MPLQSRVQQRINFSRLFKEKGLPESKTFHELSKTKAYNITYETIHHMIAALSATIIATGAELEAPRHFLRPHGTPAAKARRIWGNAAPGRAWRLSRAGLPNHPQARKPEKTAAGGSKYRQEKPDSSRRRCAWHEAATPLRSATYSSGSMVCLGTIEHGDAPCADSGHSPWKARHRP